VHGLHCAVVVRVGDGPGDGDAPVGADGDRRQRRVVCRARQRHGAKHLAAGAQQRRVDAARLGRRIADDPRRGQDLPVGRAREHGSVERAGGGLVDCRRGSECAPERSARGRKLAAQADQRRPAELERPGGVVIVAGALAKDEASFDALYRAFQQQDKRGYQGALRKLTLLGRCRLACEWIRSKECVFLCLELAGPPKPSERALDPRRLAEAIAKLTEDEGLLKELTAAVEERDGKGFNRVVEALDIAPLRHLFCHWVCMVRYRLICGWLCGPLVERPELFVELQTAGRALSMLVRDERAFEAAAAASDADQPAEIGEIVRGAGLFAWCDYICVFFCSWRCTLACLRFCRTAPRFEDPVKEAFAFAKATHRLAAKPAELRRLSIAVGAGDVKTYQRIVGELKLAPYCLQLCHWICSLRCRLWCLVICPPPFNHPWFTHVGDFGVFGDFDTSTGLTNNSQAGHGGPGYGFYDVLSLYGLCPKTDPANPGQAMAYRFLFQQAGVANPTPITSGFVNEVLIGSRYTTWNSVPNTPQTVRLRATNPTPTPPPFDGNPTPPVHYIVPDPDGWVTVDPQAFDDAFSGYLMGFNSAVGFPGGNPAPGVAAGTDVPSANERNGFDVALIFQATRVSTIAAVNGGAEPDYTNALAKIRINNWNEVGLLDLLEFQAGACTPLTSTLTIQYTTDHELLAEWSIAISSAATIPGPPVFPSGTGPRGSFGSDVHSLTGGPGPADDWPSCSYLVTLSTRRRLTTGLTDDPSKSTGDKTFYID